MSDHIQIPASPVHPLFAWAFVGLSIWLSTWTIAGVDLWLHIIIYVLSGISALMASVASYFAIRHYRLQMALLKKKTDKPEE